MPLLVAALAVEAGKRLQHNKDNKLLDRLAHPAPDNRNTQMAAAGCATADYGYQVDRQNGSSIPFAALKSEVRFHRIANDSKPTRCGRKEDDRRASAKAELLFLRCRLA